MRTLKTTFEYLGTAPMAYADWWSDVSRCKSVAQWAVACQKRGAPEEAFEAATLETVGSALFCHLGAGGSWSELALQEAPDL